MSAAPARRPKSGLGEFLRGRRVRIDPGSVEIVVDRRRRQVPGLRREELAELASISTDYYTRLEQGRERHPSPQVLTALARALRLDDDETGHLFLLGGQAAPVAVGDLGPDIRTLLGLLRVPVAVFGPALDVRALNPAGAAFYSGFARTDNFLRMVFCDPAAPPFYADEWDLTARAAVAALRASSAQFPDHEGIGAVAAELGARSEHFVELWSAHEIRVSPCVTTHHIHHPVVGDVHVYCNTFAALSAPGHYLQVFTPEPGSASADRVERLAASGG